VPLRARGQSPYERAAHDADPGLTNTLKQFVAAVVLAGALYTALSVLGVTAKLQQRWARPRRPMLLRARGAIALLLGAAGVGAFLGPPPPSLASLRRAARLPRARGDRAPPLRASAANPEDLPKPVPGFFPLWESNVLQTFGLINPDDAVVADLPFLAQAIADRPKDYLQQLLNYYLRYGGIFKVCLMPKAFLIVSDPVVIRHILAESALKYDKGILADILQPIMGSGLIPADLATWATRRRQLVPAFHKAWLQSTVGLFNDCSARLCQSLDKTAGRVVNMEAMYNSVALDIIGKAVFNFDFQSVENTSPIIDAVYGLMQEAEHRSFFLLPYWKVGGGGVAGVAGRSRSERPTMAKEAY